MLAIRVRGRAARGGGVWADLADTFAIGLTSGGVVLYDVATERAVGDPLQGHGAGVQGVAFSGDGRYMFSVADDGVVGVWGDNRVGGSLPTDSPPTSATPRRRLTGAGCW